MSGGVEQCLDPARLRRAVISAADELGVVPSMVLLHNPERTLAELPPRAGAVVLGEACLALREAVRAGWAGGWGIASWSPQPVLAAVRAPDPSEIPAPDVLMVRAGLLVGTKVLDAADALAGRWQLGARQRWGMSPFAGRARDPVWTDVDADALFLARGQNVTRMQAAFRVAYDLPVVSRMAVGASSVTHLRELVDSVGLRSDPDQVARYRALLHGPPRPAGRRVSDKSG
ncbi:aldo/keto reductase [Solihabitans fulvus]|uniref:aldo/keto reductase n=1 Tax=Solihabitans fulvus TaxID=1892852 RepID=UPI0016620508|nr:aldo/keto reductase [Solihabitans fulvus]